MSKVDRVERYCDKNCIYLLLLYKGNYILNHYWLFYILITFLFSYSLSSLLSYTKWTILLFFTTNTLLSFLNYELSTIRLVKQQQIITRMSLVFINGCFLLNLLIVLCINILYYFLLLVNLIIYVCIWYHNNICLHLISININALLLFNSLSYYLFLELQSAIINKIFHIYLYSFKNLST